MFQGSVGIFLDNGFNMNVGPDNRGETFFAFPATEKMVRKSRSDRLLAPINSNIFANFHKIWQKQIGINILQCCYEKLQDFAQCVVYLPTFTTSKSQDIHVGKSNM